VFLFLFFLAASQLINKISNTMSVGYGNGRSEMRLKVKLKIKVRNA